MSYSQYMSGSYLSITSTLGNIGFLYFFYRSKAELYNSDVCILISLMIKVEVGNSRDCTSYVVVQSLSHVWLFVTPGTVAYQASLSFLISQSLFKLMSIELMFPSSHLILCPPLLLLPSIFPSIRVFSKESALCIRSPKYWYTWYIVDA